MARRIYQKCVVALMLHVFGKPATTRKEVAKIRQATGHQVESN